MKFSLKEYKIACLFILAIFSSQSGFAKNSNFIITGGASFNYNIYISDFNTVPGYKSCCPSYRSAFSPGYSFYSGVEYITGAKSLGFNFNFSLMASYGNLSAQYSEEEFVSNVINPDDYTQAFSAHILDANVKFIGIEPGLVLYPDLNLPIFFRLGFVVGFLLNPEIKLEERLISPDYVAFDSLGNRIRNSQNGKLPDASLYFIAPFIGVGYELYHNNNFNISSFLQFNFSIKNISNSLNWKTHFIRAGFALNYNIPSATLPPPLTPPIPELPLPPSPPAPNRLELALDIFNDGKKLITNDTVEIPIITSEYRYRYSIVPIIFFEKNSTEFSDNYSNLLDGLFFGLGKNNNREKIGIIQSAINYLKQNPAVNINIFAYTLDDELPDINQHRLNFVVSKFVESGIDKRRIITNEIIKSAKIFPVEQLRDENRKIIFTFSDNNNLLFEELVDRKTEVNDMIFSVKPDVFCDSKVYKLHGEILLDGNKVSEFSNELQSFIYKPIQYSNHSSLLSFTGEVNILEEQSRKTQVNLHLKIKEEKKVFNNYYHSNGTSGAEYHILGFCEFDKSQFYIINQNVVDYIKEAISSGAKVEILPLTDNIGTIEHNSQLAKARASNAIKLLNATEKNVKIVYPDNFLFTNDKPSGRMLNRTVICRIIRKVK